MGEADVKKFELALSVVNEAPDVLVEQSKNAVTEGEHVVYGTVAALCVVTCGLLAMINELNVRITRVPKP